MERIEVINKRLLEHYGKFETNDANFRIVFSDDQIEKQLCDMTKEGFYLLTPEVQEVKKYPWIHHKYVLERIVPVPDFQIPLLGRKVSYEPIWVFEDEDKNPLPPVWEAVYWLVNTLLDRMTYKSPAEKLPESEQNTFEALEEKAKGLEQVLYGNETQIGDSLATGSAVGYGKYRRNDTRFNNNPIKGF